MAGMAKAPGRTEIIVQRGRGEESPGEVLGYLDLSDEDLSHPATAIEIGQEIDKCISGVDGWQREPHTRPKDGGVLPFNGWFCGECRQLVADGINPHDGPDGARCRTSLILPVLVVRA